MAKTDREPQPKPLRWIGGSKEDVSAFPEEVKRRVGGALWDAQIGGTAPFAKPLKGFGVATPKSDLDLIERRLRRAQEDYELWRGSQRPR